MVLLWSAGAAFALEPPGKNENADLGPNEVTKDKIGEVSLDADNPFDTAAPGTASHARLSALAVEQGWGFYDAP